MMLSSVRRLRGPNVYLARPVLVGRLHADHPRFAERLLGVLGELSERIGRPVGFGRTDRVGDATWDVVAECPRDEPPDSPVSEELLRLALEFVAAGEPTDAAARLAALRRAHVRDALPPWSAAIAAAARESDIPVERIGTLGLLRLGYGRHRRLAGAAMTDRTSAVGTHLARDPELTRQLLGDLGLPVVDRRLPGRDYSVLVVAGRVVNAVERPGRDVTADVHPDVDELCRRAGAAAGLDIAGVDLRLPDIAHPLPVPRSGCAPSAGITGLCAGPDVRFAGAPGRAVVDALYPPGAPSRVPTVAVTGDEATTIAGLVAYLLAEGERRVGLAGAAGAVVAGRPVGRTDDSGPRRAQVVLGDPTVDVAVLEVDHADVVAGGLGYDWADVAVVTAAPADGEPTGVASLVAERVRDGGTLVVNADEPGAADFVARAVARADGIRVVVTCADAANPVVRRHLQGGGCAYVLDAGWLTQLRDCYKARVMQVGELPDTAAPADALAALAAAAAHGLSPATIRRRLNTFDAPAPAGVRRIDAAPAILPSTAVRKAA